MKIVVFAVGKNLDEKDIQIWLKFYHQSNTNLEPILIYDHNVNLEILNCWPYEKRLSSLNYKLLNATDVHFLSLFLDFTYVDILKVSAFKQIGECIVTDLDVEICKKISLDNIPDCSYGLVPHHKYSSFFNNKKQHIYNVDFLNFDFLQWVNTGVQIQREDVLPVFLKLFQTNFQRINTNLDFICFAQATAGLALRYMNGVYLQPEWNWYYQTPIENKSVIIKHYYGSEAKKEFRKLL